MGLKSRGAEEFRNECHDILFGRDSNAAAFSTQCHGIDIKEEKIVEVSMLNAAAFTTQCRGIRFTLEKNFEVRTFNAAALSTQCRGIQVR